jgi:hypothetical protein
MSKFELERNIKSLDIRIAKAPPVLAKALQVHRAAMARKLDEYYEGAGVPLFAGCIGSHR